MYVCVCLVAVDLAYTSDLAVLVPYVDSRLVLSKE